MAEEFVDARKPSVKPNPIRLILLSIVLVILILVLLIVIYARKGGEVTTVVPVMSPGVSPTVTASKETASDRVVDDGVTWSKPVKLDDLGLVEKSGDESEGLYVGTEYFKTGSTSTGADIILAKIKTEMMGERYDFYRFLKRDDKYYIIRRNSDLEPYSSAYSVDAEIEDNFVLNSLLPDQKITSGATNLILQEWMGKNPELDSATDGKKVGETRWGGLYMREGSDLENSEGLAKAASYYIVLNDSTKVGYEPSPSFMRDDNTLNLTGIVGGAKSVKFSKVTTSGCGGSALGTFPIVTSKSGLTGKKELGTSSLGSKVYYISDVENALVKYGFEMYKMDGMGDKKSIEDFAKEYGVVFWTDDYGTTQIFMNQDFLPQVECGKPVIYLYPTKEMPVRVKVGADITISDPEYKKSGWEVIAKPNGDLVVDGKTYPNLFWEGLGWGEYPQIKSGTIVKTADARETITDQLKSMNLNDREIADFLEFWLPKMPKTEYVRISWIYGEQMDELAPLQVTPKPDSVIRVFLDYAGLEKPIALEKQVLPKFDRNGFSVVEWGGLLVK